MDREGGKERKSYEAVPGGFISHRQFSHTHTHTRSKGDVWPCQAGSMLVKSECVYGRCRPSYIKEQFV